MTEDGDYDCVDYGGINDKSIRNIAETIEYETIQNPYYGGEIHECPTAIKTIQNPYYDVEIDEGPSTIKTMQNPYYGGVIWIYPTHCSSNCFGL